MEIEDIDMGTDCSDGRLEISDTSSMNKNRTHEALLQNLCTYPENDKHSLTSSSPFVVVRLRVHHPYAERNLQIRYRRVNLIGRSFI